MSKSAKVSSIDALPRFKTVLTRYEERMRDGLTILMLEVRRGLDWLENDRAPYWRREHRRAYDRLAEARQALERKELTINPEDRPSAYEEKKEFEKAKRRLQYVEEKMETVKKWIQVTRQESEKFEAQLARLGNFLDNDLSKAITSLGRMHDALDKYAQTNMKSGSGESSAARTTKSPTAKNEPDQTDMNEPTTDEGDG